MRMPGRGEVEGKWIFGCVPCRNKRLDDEFAAEQRRHRLDAVERLLPKRYGKFTFSIERYGGSVELERFGDKHARMVDRGEQWRPDGSIIFTGPIGCGKTVLVAAIARAQLVRYTPLVWWEEGDLIDAEKSSFSTKGDGGAPSERAKTVQLLVLDDLGRGAQSEFGHNLIGNIIAYRHGHDLSTIITTNLGTADVAERYGQRIVSRLLEMAPAGFVEMPGQDRRMS